MNGAVIQLTTAFLVKMEALMAGIHRVATERLCPQAIQETGKILLAMAYLSHLATLETGRFQAELAMSLLLVVLAAGRTPVVRLLHLATRAVGQMATVFRACPATEFQEMVSLEILLLLQMETLGLGRTVPPLQVLATLATGQTQIVATLQLPLKDLLSGLTTQHA